jgi:hypothetical protein
MLDRLETISRCPRCATPLARGEVAASVLAETRRKLAPGAGAR